MIHDLKPGWRGACARWGLLTTCLMVSPGCATLTKSSASARVDEVFVMGMIHGGHRTNALYGIDTVKAIIRSVDPDFILCEIPPDRLVKALAQFRETDTVTESRVKRFPEYVEAVFPLSREMEFVIVPCAGWTKAMADDRKAKLEAYKSSRSADFQEMERAEAKADQTLKDEGLAGDPMGIHTDRYDAIVKQGLEPYNRLFNDALGAGGWDNINRSHYRLIEEAINRHKGEGKRFLIMFGAWHKYWIKEQLRRRSDITLRSIQAFVPPSEKK